MADATRTMKQFGFWTKGKISLGIGLAAWVGFLFQVLWCVEIGETLKPYGGPAYGDLVLNSVLLNLYFLFGLLACLAGFNLGSSELKESHSSKKFTEWFSKPGFWGAFLNFGFLVLVLLNFVYLALMIYVATHPQF
jgi:hypothetical protein